MSGSLRAISQIPSISPLVPPPLSQVRTARIKIPNEMIKALKMRQSTVNPSEKLAPAGIVIQSPDSAKYPSRSNSSSPNARQMDSDQEEERGSSGGSNTGLRTGNS